MIYAMTMLHPLDIVEMELLAIMSVLQRESAAPNMDSVVRLQNSVVQLKEINSVCWRAPLET